MYLTSHILDMHFLSFRNCIWMQITETGNNGGKIEVHISLSYKKIQRQVIQGRCSNSIDITDLVTFYFLLHQPNTQLPSSNTHYGPWWLLQLQLSCPISGQQERGGGEGQIVWTNLLVRYLLVSSNSRCPTSGYMSWSAFNQVATPQSFSWVYCCPENQVLQLRKRAKWKMGDDQPSLPHILYLRN